MNVPAWGWAATLIGIAALLVGDIALHRLRDLAGSRPALIETAAWIALSVVVGVVVGVTWGWGASGQYFSGYLLEKSLSVDNVVAFALLFRGFCVPMSSQRLVLYWGVLGALLARGGFIAAGAAFVRNVDWAFYPFGAIVVLAGLRMARGGQFDIEHGRLIRAIRRLVPITAQPSEGRFVVRESGRRLATPLLLALLAVETTDLVFAADSIPAIFGVTSNVFIVFTSNAFAVLGLRSLYFVLADAMERISALTKGLAVLLVLIGLKMLVRPLLEVPTTATLGGIAAVLAITLLASSRRRRSERAGTEP